MSGLSKADLKRALHLREQIIRRRLVVDAWGRRAGELHLRFHLAGGEAVPAVFGPGTVAENAVLQVGLKVVMDEYARITADLEAELRMLGGAVPEPGDRE